MFPASWPQGQNILCTEYLCGWFLPYERIEMSELYEFSANGWNTFEVRSLAAVVHFPSGLEIKVGLKSLASDICYREFRWPELVRLGAHMPDCSYAAVTLKTPECRLLVEFASEDNALAVRVTPTENTGKLKPFADVFFYAGFEGQISLDGQSANVSAVGNTFRVCSPSGATVNQEASAKTTTFESTSDEEFLLFVSTGNQCASSEKTKEFIEARKAVALEWEKRYDKPELQAAYEGMWRSVIWNTIYAPSIKRPVTVVSRDWCVDGNYGDFVLFEWDTFFAALQASTGSKELAYNNVRAVLSGITERGFVPSIFCELGKSRDRSMLPVGSIIVWKLYEKFQDKEFLKEVFPQLLGWHNWWMQARDGNGDGLLEWGSDNFPSPHPQWQAYTLQAARYESGLDNSPMYDDVVFNEETCTMELTDVGLNSAYAMDGWALAQIAMAIGDMVTAETLRAEHEEMKVRINKMLWSEADGIYLNRRWNGEFYKRLAPTLFYPMTGRVAEPERAVRMVREHLLNDTEFWGEHVVPSIARNDPAYPDQEYWRGRIWGPMNWLVYEGLKAYRLDAAAALMGEKCLNTFLSEWVEESHVHENYNGTTGDGDDARYSEPVYFWGGLLALIGLLESQVVKDDE